MYKETMMVNILCRRPLGTLFVVLWLSQHAFNSENKAVKLHIAIIHGVHAARRKDPLSPGQQTSVCRERPREK